MQNISMWTIAALVIIIGWTVYRIRINDKVRLMTEAFDPVMRVWKMFSEQKTGYRHGHKLLSEFAEVTPFSIKLRSPDNAGYLLISVTCDSVHPAACRITLRNKYVNKTTVSVVKALDSLCTYFTAYGATHKGADAAWRVANSIIYEASAQAIAARKVADDAYRAGTN